MKNNNYLKKLLSDLSKELHIPQLRAFLNSHKSLKILLPVILIPIILVFVFFVVVFVSFVKPIENLVINQDNITLDINDKKIIEIIYEPEGVYTGNIEFISSDNKILEIEKIEDDNLNDNKIYGEILPLAEGQAEIFVQVDNIKSEAVVIKIVDEDRIADEEAKKAEEEAKLKAEEEAKKAEEEKQKAEAEAEKSEESTTVSNAEENKGTTSTQNSSSNSSSSSTSNPSSSGSSSSSSSKPIGSSNNTGSNSSSNSSSSVASNNNQSTVNESNNNTTDNSIISNGNEVYITPTGKRYHLDPDCGGKNSKLTTLDEAIAMGLTPCKKCAQ